MVGPRASLSRSPRILLRSHTQSQSQDHSLTRSHAQFTFHDHSQSHSHGHTLFQFESLTQSQFLDQFPSQLQSSHQLRLAMEDMLHSEGTALEALVASADMVA